MTIHWTVNNLDSIKRSVRDEHRSRGFMNIGVVKTSRLTWRDIDGGTQAQRHHALAFTNMFVRLGSTHL